MNTTRLHDKSHRLMLTLIKYKRVHIKGGRQTRRQMGLKMYNVCPFLHASCGSCINMCATDETGISQLGIWALGPQQCWLAMDSRVVNGFTRSQNSVTFHQHILLRFAYLYGTPSLRPTLSWLHFCYSNDACGAWLICSYGILLVTAASAIVSKTKLRVHCQIKNFFVKSAHRVY